MSIFCNNEWCTDSITGKKKQLICADTCNNCNHDEYITVNYKSTIFLHSRVTNWHSRAFLGRGKSPAHLSSWRHSSRDPNSGKNRLRLIFFCEANSLRIRNFSQFCEFAMRIWIPDSSATGKGFSHFQHSCLARILFFSN